MSGLTQDLTQIKADIAAAAASVIGVGQTCQNVLASRASGVTYTNTTGKPIFVYVRGNVLANGSLNAYINERVLMGQGAGNNIYHGGGISLLVPDGSTYKVNSNVGIANWEEIR